MIIEAYCLKLKAKAAMVNPVIGLTSKGGYICRGTSAEGHKMSLIMSKTTAEAAVAAGAATKEGW